MKTYTEKELKKILKDHALWLKNPKIGKNANLRRVNLSQADLSEANLSQADLSKSDLSYINLSGANLSKADLSGTNISWVNLFGANLAHAKLLYFSFNKNTAYFTFNNYLKIGCHYETLNWWTKNIKKVGLKNNYTKEEILAYTKFLKICIKQQKSVNKR